MKKFKCLNCGKTFEAEENSYVSCPSCQSDNVKPVGRSWVTPILLTLVFLVAGGIGYKVTTLLQPSNIGEKDSLSIQQNESYSELNDSVSAPNPPGPIVALIIKNTAPVLDKSKKSYSFNVEVQNVPEGSTPLFVLTEPFDSAKVVAQNNDGHFKQIKPQGSNGAYQLYVSAKGAETITQTITGFDEIKPVVKRMSAAELESLLLNNPYSVMEHPQINNKCSIKCSNLKSGDPRPESLTAITQRISMGTWVGLSVTGVGYDDTGRINSVSIVAKYSEE